jgi:tol-pal system protein YbgF
MSAPACSKKRRTKRATGGWQAAALLSLFVSLGSAAPAMAQQNDTITTRLDRLERMLDNKGLLELVRQIEQLQQEVRRLRGELEEQAFTLEQVRKGQRDVYASLDQRVTTLEQGGTISLARATGSDAGVATGEPPLPTVAGPGNIAVAGEPSGQSWAVDAQDQTAIAGAGRAPARPPAADAFVVPSSSADEYASQTPPGSIAPPSDPTMPTETVGDPLPMADPGGNVIARNAPAPVGSGYGDDAPVARRPAPGVLSNSEASEAAYRDAFTKLKAGQYEESIAAFNAYLQQYPDSQYGDNAQYWLGEAYYVMRQFEPAIEQYQKLVATYPDSQKQSHALLKIAYSYAELGSNDQALSVLNELKARFPGSAAARLADERIQRIRAQQTP